MAEFDTSIYKNPQGAFVPKIEDPVDRNLKLAHLLQYKQAAGKNELEQQQLRTKLQRDADLNQVYREAGGDQNKLATLLPQRGFVPEYQTLQKQILEQGKLRADADKSKAERTKIVAAGMRELAAQFEDTEQGYQGFREAVGAEYGPAIAQRLPPVAAAGWVQKSISSADQKFELNKPIMKEVDTGQQKLFVDVNPVTNPSIKEFAAQMQMTPAQIAQDSRALQQIAEMQRHNRTTEGIAGANLALSRQRLELDKNKPEYGDLKEVQAPDGSRLLIQQDKRTGDWVDANTKQPVTGFGPQPRELTPEASGRLTMVRQASNDIDTVRGILFDKNGQLNRSTLAAMQVPGGGLGEQARTAVSALENAASAKYRLETGAAGNQGEEASIRRRFVPTVMDSPQSAKFKLDRLQEFMNMSIEQMRESGMISDNTLQRAKGAGRPALGSFSGGSRPPLETFGR